MSNHIFFSLFAAFAIGMLVWGLKSGEMWLKYSSFRRDDHPIMFWISAAIMASFAGISIWAAIVSR